MIKLLVLLVAIGVFALGLWIVRHRQHKGAKLTDKRARAEVMKQLLALSDKDAHPAIEADSEKSKNMVKALPTQPPAPPAMTRQQRRAEQRKKDKLAFAKSQRA